MVDLKESLPPELREPQRDEAQILAELGNLLSSHTCRPSAEAPARECRGSFLAALLAVLAERPDCLAIHLPNLRLVSPLEATSLAVDKAVLLPGLQSEAPLCLDQSRFRQLDLSGGSFPALLARGLLVECDLALRGVRISHALDLSIARIGGNLDLTKAILTIPGAVEDGVERAGDTAQEDKSRARRESYSRFEMGSLIDARIDGSFRLCDARLDRKIRMTNARIGGDFDLWGVEFQDVGEFESGLICTNCDIGEKLILSESRCDDNTRIALDYSRMRILQFGRDQSRWPRKNRISLEGTTFEAFAFIQRQRPGEGLNVFDTDLTIALLKRNGPAFYRQPWRQAATSIRQKGYGDQALEIMVAMEKEAGRVEVEQHRARLAETGLGLFGRLRLSLKRVRRAVTNSLWWFADYGYRPEKTLWSLIALLVLNIGLNTAILYSYRDVIVPTSEALYLEGINPWEGEPKEYPDFNPIIYGLDTLIPALNLGQEQAWQPNWKDPFGIAYAIYLYIVHMFFGLLLIGVLVAGISKRLSDDI